MLKKQNQSGFSLVELMVTVGIIALMAAIGIPSVLNYLPSIRLRTAAQDLYADMQRAKMTSVKTNKVVSMNFTHANDINANCPTGSYLFEYTDINGNDITVANVNMQNDVCILKASFNPSNSGFKPDGTPSGFTVNIKLTHPDAVSTYQITQSAAGGISIRTL